MSDRVISDLTGDIYDAAAGGTPWSIVGRRLVQLVGAETGSLMTSNPAGGAELLYHSDFPLDAVRAYQDHYSAVDLWTNRAADVVLRRRMRPTVFRSGILVPDGEFLRSEFYNDFGRALRLRYVVGTVVPLADGGAMPVGLHRPDGAAPFEREHAERLQLVLPHLRRAMEIRARLTVPPQEAPARAALNALGTAVVVVDADLEVVLSNSAAETLAHTSGAFAFNRAPGCPPGRLTMRALHHTDEAVLLRTVRATALGGTAGGAVPLRDASNDVVTAALVSPLPRALAPEDARLENVNRRALVLLRDLRSRSAGPPAEMLRDLFKLTAAEADVARALAGCGTKERVAALRGARVSTVRTQVRAILAKTGAANLRDLERLLAALDGS